MDHDIELQKTREDQYRPSYFLAALFFLVPLCFYLSLIGKWSMSGDEIYTMRDSSEPAWEILRNQARPIYYLICHYSMMLPIPVEVSLRLPASIAAGLIAPIFYLFLWRPNSHWAAISSAILLIFHPWIFEFSQLGRFYTLTLLFSSISALSLYRWIYSARLLWIGTYIGFAVLAILTHTTAITLFPAGILAVVVTKVRDRRSISLGKKERLVIGGIIGGLILGSAIIAGPVYQTFINWTESKIGKFADYSALSLLVATALFSGIQLWALAFVPLLKFPKHWSKDELFLGVFFLGMLVPYLLMAPLGGGVAPRFLFASLPGLVALAAVHWQTAVQKINHWQLNVALGAALLAVYVPHFTSTLKDGNHYDYRAAARFVDSLSLENPLILSSAHGMLSHYLANHDPVEELGVLKDLNGGRTNESSFPGRAILDATQRADATGRPLILVSNEDRLPIDRKARRWVGDRFALIHVFEQPRFDHRRNRLAIYEYRPKPAKDNASQ